MTFPEITTWSHNVVLLFQVIGGALAAICIAVIAIIIMTSFGNENRMASAKFAAIGVALGIAVLIGAEKIAGVFQALVGFIH